MTNDTPYTVTLNGREVTEDGDYLFKFTVLAKGFAGVAEYNADQKNNYNAEPVIIWKGAGNGYLKHTFTRYVDGAVVAIEASNDRWASMQDAGFDDYRFG